MVEIKRRNKNNKKKRQYDRSGTWRNKERRAQIAEQALELRIKGWSFKMIADELSRQLGYEVNMGSVYKWVRAAAKKIDDSVMLKADHLRRLELTRLDKLLRALEDGRELKTVEKVVGRGKDKKVIEFKAREIDLAQYVYAYIRIMDRRSQYIPGLDAAKEQRVEIGEKFKELMEGSKVEVVELLKQLAKRE